MGEPTRGSRVFGEVGMMLEIGNLSNTEFCFSRSLGKCGKALAVAQKDWKMAVDAANEEYKQIISAMVDELEPLEKALYKVMNAIYHTQPNM